MNYNMLERSKIETSEEWDKWVNKIPKIKFPSKWQIQIIPPFAGAMVRFRVFSGKKIASVYLDCYDALGCYGEPYWEVYCVKGDVARCKMKDTKTLLKNINLALK